MVPSVQRYLPRAEIYWVLGHMGVKRNEKTDEAVKEATEKAGTPGCRKRFALLALVGRMISERKSKEAKH